MAIVKIPENQLDLTNTNAAIGAINDKIPAQASSDNKLADKAFVNSSVQTNSAHFRGNWPTWADVPTNVNDYPADNFGVKTPGPNDYMVVQADETQDGGTWRYKYTGAWPTDGKNGWQPEYEVNETPLTAEQLAALNSGITDTAVAQITTNKNNISSLSSNKLDKTEAASTYATQTSVNSALALKQSKTLDTSLTIGGVSQTTVEGALGALNTAKQDNITVINGGDSTNA